MAAPTGLPDPEILGRLETILDDIPPAPANPEDSREFKQKIEVPPTDDPTPIEDGDDTPQLAADAESEAEPEVAEAADAEESDDDAIDTLADLAKMFEVEESELLSSLHIASENGERIPLAKIIETYKNAPEAARNREAFKAREAAFESEAVQLRMRTDESIRELAIHSQVLLDMTNEEFADINWNQLKVEDPAQYVFMKERQRERGEAIQAAIEKMKSLDGQRKTEMATAVHANRSAEISRLHAKMPEWVNPEIAQVAMAETATFLTDAGFTQDEINNISDHRYLLVAYDAAQYRKLQKQAPEKLSKLRGLPKTKSVLRSTARRDPSRDAQSNVQKKFDRLKQTGDERDAARLFEELM